MLTVAQDFLQKRWPRQIEHVIGIDWDKFAPRLPKRTRPPKRLHRGEVELNWKGRGGSPRTARARTTYIPGD